MKQIVLQLLLRPLALGHVAIHNHQLRDFALRIPDRAGQRLQHPPAPILVLDPILELLSNPALPRLPRRLQHSQPVIRMNLLKRRSLPQLRRRIPQDPLVSRTVVQPPPLHVDQRNHVCSILRDDLKQFLLLLRRPVNPKKPKLLVDDKTGQRPERNPKPWQMHTVFFRVTIGGITRKI